MALWRSHALWRCDAQGGSKISLLPGRSMSSLLQDKDRSALSHGRNRSFELQVEDRAPCYRVVETGAPCVLMELSMEPCWQETLEDPFGRHPRHLPLLPAYAQQVHLFFLASLPRHAHIHDASKPNSQRLFHVGHPTAFLHVGHPTATCGAPHRFPATCMALT